MRRYFAFLVCAAVWMAANAGTSLSAFRGVWANDSTEVVVTDSVCVAYFRVDSTMQAVFEIPGAGLRHRTVFATGGKVSTDSLPAPLVMSRDKNTLTVDGRVLRKVEDINIVQPYTMPQCTSGHDVGRCLQQWRSGAKYGAENGFYYCEINTNRHMFVYLVNPSMVYIRAAATRNNNNGTLFFQNIRMMKNNNTGEYTMHIDPANLAVAAGDLEIDNSKFQPDRCTFTPDGGIYWSLISFEPDCILINGCGETYTVPRPSRKEEIDEWIEYKPYTTDSGFPRL